MFKRILILVVILSMPVTSAVASNQGIPDRVSALEELSLQQQGEIDQNSADIANLKSWVVRDANGQQLGDFLGFEDWYVMTRVEMDGHVGTMLLSPESVQLNATIWYLAYHCRGLPFAEKVRGIKFFDDIIFSWKRDETRHLAPYAIDKSVNPSAQYTMSYIGLDGLCRNTSTRARYVYRLIPTPLIDDNLLDFYPGPIEVVRE